MTTIAYHLESNTIASDGRSTRDGVIMTDSAVKVISANGVDFHLCGSVCDYDMFIKMYFGEKSELIPECGGFVYDSGKLYRCGVTNELEFWRQPVEHNDAVGSGWMFAISAMDHGSDASGAVAYAAKRDSGTGGVINVYKL